MNFDVPKAVFGGLTLIAAAIYFGPGSVSVDAENKETEVHKIAICDVNGKCADLFRFKNVYGNWGGNYLGVAVGSGY